MIHNTENNHLRYWFNNDYNQQWRVSDFDTTSMSVGGCSRKPMSLCAELIRNARALYRHYPDLTVFMSGGLDSEMALQSFLSAGITPKIATIRFPNNNNMHDIGPMMELLDQKKIPYTVIDFDLTKFVNSRECYEIGIKYQAYTLYQQMLLRVAEDFSAPMITIDEIELEKHTNIDYATGNVSSDWVFLKKEDQDGVWRRFNEKTGIPALNNFYTYSPETILAFLNISTVDDLVNDRIPGKLAWTSSKVQIYSTLGYEFRKRPKWHGVENYMHLWDAVKYNISSKGLSFNEREYAISVRQLKENLTNGIETICQVA
jgi:hypothetical protein